MRPEQPTALSGITALLFHPFGNRLGRHFPKALTEFFVGQWLLHLIALACCPKQVIIHNFTPYFIS
jgi:hypothetical protein